MTVSTRAPVDSAFPDAAHRPSARDLPSLDGLRAISIGFVILGHTSQWFAPSYQSVFAHLAHFGVRVFFVISGYLITSLLRKDIEKRGAVQLGRFYLRRTLRIFPPYYAYLAIVAVGVIAAGWKTPGEVRWWPAVGYVSNFFNTNWEVTGHSWSLSMEEQFYLLWPVMLAMCVRARGAGAGARLASGIAALGLIAFPLMRIAVFAVSRNGNLTGALLFDYVAAGSAMALFLSGDGWARGRRALGSVLESGATPIAFMIALSLHLLLSGRTRWWFALDTTLVTPVEALLLAIFVAWAVRNPSHIVGRLLNVRVLRVVGIGSYSLYLWQQLFFFGPGSAFGSEWPLAAKIAASCGCAALSYALIERPALRLRARVEAKMFAGSEK